MTVLSWRGDPQVKADAVAAMRRHREDDRFARGTYLKRGHYVDRFDLEWVGCFHGCLTAEAVAAERGVAVLELTGKGVKWWVEGERLWGIPVMLGALLDETFENFDSRFEAGNWAVEVTEAIPVGVDLGPLSKELYEGRLPGGPYEMIALLRKAGDQ